MTTGLLTSSHYESLASSSQMSQRLEELTIQERKILRLIILEHSSKEIANQLSIATETVKRHRKNILKKLQISGKVEFSRILRYLEMPVIGSLTPNYP